MVFVPPGPTVVSAGYFLKPVLGVGCGELIFLSSRPFSHVLASARCFVKQPSLPDSFTLFCVR